MSDLKAVRTRLKTGNYDGTDIMAAWIAIDELEQLQQQVKDLTEAKEKLKADYNELIFAVANKWPNELRHQTALRYIIERESSNNPEGQED